MLASDSLQFLILKMPHAHHTFPVSPVHKSTISKKVYFNSVDNMKQRLISMRWCLTDSEFNFCHQLLSTVGRTLFRTKLFLKTLENSPNINARKFLNGTNADYCKHLSKPVFDDKK